MEKIRKIFDFFKEKGINVFLVGGAVRDILMGKEPKDVDMVALSDTKTLVAAGGKFVDPVSCIPVFLFNIEGEKVEVALPRKEVKTGEGYKGFAFETEGVTLEEDLQRRDFTINAIAMDSDGNIIDPFGGRIDIKNKTLRVVNPQAFAEDPLRVIRLCRFSCKGFTPTAETISLANRVSEAEFKALPVERFTNELLKALTEPHTEKFFEVLIQIPTACKVFFPELLKTVEIPAGPAEFHPEGSLFNHITETIRKCSEPESKFMALVHDFGKLLTPAEMLPKHIGHDSKKAAEFVVEIFKKMKFPNKFIKLIPVAVEFHLKVQRPMRDGKLIRVAESVFKAQCEKAFINLVKADGCNSELVKKIEKAFEIAKVPARELFDIDIIKNLNPLSIQNRILNAKVELFKLNIEA